jgi:hypothetical protein
MVGVNALRSFSLQREPTAWSFIINSVLELPCQILWRFVSWLSVAYADAPAFLVTPHRHDEYKDDSSGHSISGWWRLTFSQAELFRGQCFTRQCSRRQIRKTLQIRCKKGGYTPPFIFFFFQDFTFFSLFSLSLFYSSIILNFHSLFLNYQIFDDITKVPFKKTACC